VLSESGLVYSRGRTRQKLWSTAGADNANVGRVPHYLNYPRKTDVCLKDMNPQEQSRKFKTLSFVANNDTILTWRWQPSGIWRSRSRPTFQTCVLPQSPRRLMALIMLAVRTSETSVYYETTQHHIPERCHLHTRLGEKLKSHKVLTYLFHGNVKPVRILELRMN
jgi:hypothetical protein